MTRSINESIAAEELERHEFLDVGPRALTAFEARQLEADPCQPIYLTPSQQESLDAAYENWWINIHQNPRAIPATVSREFVRAGGSL